jgi:hypothetical protein
VVLVASKVVVVKKAVTGNLKLMHWHEGDTGSKVLPVRYIPSLPLNSNLFETMARSIKGFRLQYTLETWT